MNSQAVAQLISVVGFGHKSKEIIVNKFFNVAYEVYGGSFGEIEVIRTHIEKPAAEIVLLLLGSKVGFFDNGVFVCIVN